MNLWIRKFLFENWKRKSFSLIFAVFIWLLVDRSLTSTRTLFNVPVRIVNIPSNKTIEGIQANGKINKKVNLTLVGNKECLEVLQPNDIEVVLDASGKPDEWLASITKKNIATINPEIDISNSISKIFHPSFLVRLSKLVTEKIPIIVTAPVGEAPRGYQFLDVWPYRLELTVNGPEEVLKKVRNREIKLTFNIADISKKQLDTLSKDTSSDRCNVVSYYVPDSWKFIQLPFLSDSPILINDPQCKNLRLDFIRCELLPIDNPLPIQFFYYPDQLDKVNPQQVNISSSNPIEPHNGIYLLNTPLFATGADSLFMDIVKNKIQIVVLVSHSKEGKRLPWSVQFINAQQLEDQYVSMLTEDSVDDDIRLMLHSQREEYLRNRFRSYMNRFRLHHPDGTKLKLNFDFSDRMVTASLGSHEQHHSPLYHPRSAETAHGSEK